MRMSVHCQGSLHPDSVALRVQVLRMAHEGHVGVVNVKQHCRDIICWPTIDHYIELMVKDCTACLLG